MNRRKNLLIFLVWFALGLLTSFPNLATKTLYYDEVFDVRMAVRPISAQILTYFDEAPLQNAKQVGQYYLPLYHIAVHPILTIFGINPFTVRSVAWVAGALSVAAMFFLLQRLLPKPWPFWGTLGFMVSAWHVSLSQTARQHGLFVLFVILSLLSWVYLEKLKWFIVPYALFLTAACHTYYWGLIAILPCHVAATLWLRKQISFWRVAFVGQVIAAILSVPTVFPILRGMRTMAVGSEPWSAAQIPYFGHVFLIFSSADWSELNLPDLPWIAAMAAACTTTILAGVLHWRREQKPVVRWVGLCLLGSCLLLFLAYARSLTNSILVGAPMIRRFAVLQIPLLIFFFFGLASIPKRIVGYGLFTGWVITTGFFAVKSMTADLYEGSQLVAQRVAELPGPVTTFLNWDTSLPPEQGTLSFLLERMNKSDGHQFRYFNLGSKLDSSAYDGRLACFSLMREGGFLQAQVAKFRGADPSAQEPDSKLNERMQEIRANFEAQSWSTVLAEYYPGRISYRVACFQKPEQSPAQANAVYRAATGVIHTRVLQ